MSNMHQFEKAIKERIVDPAARQNHTGGQGIIIAYNKRRHTATVLMARPGSNEPGETIKDVKCPIIPGIQDVDPEVGRPVWVQFKDGVRTYPVIVSYYSPDYEEVDRDRQKTIKNSTPRFLMEM